MKIALCFSGQPRSFKAGYEYYKRNLFDHYEVDVFIHSWNTEHNDEIVKLYNPVAYEFEDVLKDDFDSKYKNVPFPQKWPARFAVYAIYSMYKSLLLKQQREIANQFAYDWVIKSRTDYALNGIIPFEQCEKDKIYIPDCRMVPTRDFGNDQFAFGSSDVMNKRMSIWPNMQEFYDSGIPMVGEEMMSAQLKKHNLIGDKLIYVHMNNPFPPGAHNGTWHSLIRDDYESWTKK
jgi:hypothetical protein